jgi:NADH:ubiquinone oxidoreductase subunit E
MTVAVQEVIHSFEALTGNEKRQATIELLRRIVDDGSGSLTDDDLSSVADELFVELDKREASDAAT